MTDAAEATTTAAAATDAAAGTPAENAAPAAQPNPEASAEGQGGTTPAADAAGQESKPETAAEWKLTAPEGMEAFQADYEAFSSDMGKWLQDNPNADARAALAEAANRQARAASEAKTAFAKQHADQVSKWEAEARADKDIGGAKFDESVATAVKGLDAVADDAFRALLNETGLGNHPAVIRTFHKVGQQIADAPVVRGTQPAGGKGLTAALYG